MHRLEISPAADQDLDEYFAYLRQQAGVSVADRFLLAAYSAFKNLQERPRIGEPQDHRAAILHGIRKWHIPSFRNYLLFYRESEGTVLIIRVRHGSRDIDSILTEVLTDSSE